MFGNVKPGWKEQGEPLETSRKVAANRSPEEDGCESSNEDAVMGRVSERHNKKEKKKKLKRRKKKRRNIPPRIENRLRYKVQKKIYIYVCDGKEKSIDRL